MLFEKTMEKIYRGKVHTRTEFSDCVKYFTHGDFAGLRACEYDIKASAGHTLKGCFYSYESPIADRLVIFEHGMGGGHISYMREIEMLASRGYLVFAYDHTGCARSGGESINGFAQSLCDLNDVVGALLSDENYKNADISVIGHSWGGFSALNIGALYPELSHIVALSGYASVRSILRQQIPAPISGFFDRAMQIELEANPIFAHFCAKNSLKKTKARVLVIHSDDDKTVSFERNFKFLEKNLADRENIEFLAVTGKDHNPTYTDDAVKYKDAFFAELSRLLRRRKLKTPEDKAAFVASYDWMRMTEQDPEIWEAIFNFLEK